MMDRLAVYTDYRYRRSGDAVYAERAFALFLVRLAECVEAMTIMGKVDPVPGVSHYRLPEEIRFVEVPYYESLTHPVQVSRAMAQSLFGFWRTLDDVDAVWLLGPHPLVIVFAALARLRRRRVTLGVRQDFRRYVRARHPGRRWVVAAGDALEGIWRAMARRLPMVAVGPDLAAIYCHGRTLEMTVSLVEEEDIRPADDPRPDLDGPELRALSVGRLEEEKNPLLLADIIALLVKCDPRWRLIVCGEGPLEDALSRRIHELGVDDQVELRGYVPHGELREVYRLAHVLLHVSWTEGFPQVLPEAFAARLPIVATAVGGVPAAVGDAAELIGPGDAVAAARAVALLAADASLRERRVTAGVARVRSHTVDAEVQRVAEFVSGTNGRSVRLQPAETGGSGR